MRLAIVLGASLAFSLVSTVVFTMWVIKTMKEKGKTAPDKHKKGVKVPEMGGLAVVGGYFVGFVLIMLLTEDSSPLDRTMITAALACAAAALVGLVDDLMDMKQRFKAVAPFLFAIPLGLAVNDTSFVIPLVGSFDLGWAMVFLIPLAVTCSANAVNMLEGFNGLSSGLSYIICLALLVIAVLSDSREAMFILFPLSAAIIAFWFFNKYPSKVFPGDTFTLFVGAALACAAILGQMKFYILLLMIPHIIEFFLKFVGRIRRSGVTNWSKTPWASSFGKVGKDGKLKHEGDVESLTHVIMKAGMFSEVQVVLVLYAVEVVLAIIVVGLYFVD